MRSSRRTVIRRQPRPGRRPAGRARSARSPGRSRGRCRSWGWRNRSSDQPATEEDDRARVGLIDDPQQPQGDPADVAPVGVRRAAPGTRASRAAPAPQRGSVATASWTEPVGPLGSTRSRAREAARSAPAAPQSDVSTNGSSAYGSVPVSWSSWRSELITAPAISAEAERVEPDQGDEDEADRRAEAARARRRWRGRAGRASWRVPVVGGDEERPRPDRPPGHVALRARPSRSRSRSGR